jgi:hypothetical protein
VNTIEYALLTIDNAIALVEARRLCSHHSDEARREILAMLRFYRWSVEKGATPEAAAIAAQEFVAALKPAPDRPPRYNGFGQ